MALTVAGFVLFLGFMVWASSCAVLFVQKLHGAPRSESGNFIWKVLKWPSLLGIVLQPFTALTMMGFIDSFEWFSFALFLSFWWLFRNVGDDDQWKQSKRRALGKVREAGHKLVVVPEAV